MLKALLQFLGGKPTDIFDKKTGRVEHDLGKDKWEAWNSRLKDNPDYDWRHHSGRDGKPTTNQESKG